MPQTVFTESLMQLIQAIQQQQQTGLLRIEQVGRGTNLQGEIYFEGGRMFNARVGDERGNAALQQISAWEHVIYTFQIIHKPLKSSMPVSADAREFTEGREPQMRLLPSPATPQTHHLVRSPRPFPTNNSLAESSALAAETPRPTPNAQPFEPAPLTYIKATVIPSRMSQSFVLRGDTLEEYVPVPPIRMSPASQRWTTHQNPETQPAAIPRKPPVTPRLDPAPEDVSLPGPLAIFQAKITITSTQAMQSMERRERIVFVLLDGRRTVQHITNLLHQAESDVGHVLLKLTKLGFVEYVKG
ncbi:MAG: DUF4388 domain-containing protein [Ktedonobacteraceae bacterium]